MTRRHLLATTLVASSLLPTCLSADAADSPGLEIAPAGGWTVLWQRHRWQVLTIFALEEAEYLYDGAVGTSTSPMLFGEPPSMDVAIFKRLRKTGVASSH